MMKKQRLLLYLARADDPNKELIAASLSWMAEKAGFLFEAYFPSYSTGAHYPYPWPFHSHHGDRRGIGPFQGEGHAEQFYFLASAFETAVVRTSECLRFANEIESFGMEQILGSEDDPLALLKSAESFLKSPGPERLIAVGGKTDLNIAPYVYPDIYFTSSWAVRSSALAGKSLDFDTIHGLYLHAREEEDLRGRGLKTETLDTMEPDEDYREVTGRIAARWIHKAKAVAYADPHQAQHYVPFNCQEKILTLFNSDVMSCVPDGPEAMKHWDDERLQGIERGYREELSNLAKRLSGNVIYGRQATDNLITDLSKQGYVFPVFDPHRPIFPIKRKLTPRPLKGSGNSIFEAQRSRETIKREIIDAEKIPVSFLTFSADLRHVSGLRNFLEVVALRKMPWGLALNAFWFAYHQEWLQEILIPCEQGGVFPLVEPLVGSSGWGDCCEAGGYVGGSELREMLTSSLANMEKYLGKRNVPRGLYPFQDGNPEYHGKADPQFSVYEEAGLEFCFSQKDNRTPPRALYRNGDFVALNQPLTFFMFDFFHDPSGMVQGWEKRIAESGNPGYITAVFDFPLWFWSPYILDMGERLLAAIDYVKGGGDSGRLVPVLPSELADYARIAM